MERRFQRLAVVLVAVWLVLLSVPSFGEEKAMPAPKPISPADQSRLKGMPRRVFFKWSKVNHADGYGIEVSYYGTNWSSPAKLDWVNDTWLTLDFWGDQPGAWRVWAMDKKGHPGAVSHWSLFTFAGEGTEMPPPPPDTPPDFSKMPRGVRRPLPLGAMRDLPLRDPDTGETCAWPPGFPQGMKPPKPIFTPEPEFTDAARKAKEQGSVTLALRIGEDGLVKNVCIVMASRDDLGMSAIKTVRTWRFEPAMQDGKAIPYNLSTEVTFHLY